MVAVRNVAGRGVVSSGWKPLLFWPGYAVRAMVALCSGPEFPIAGGDGGGAGVDGALHVLGVFDEAAGDDGDGELAGGQADDLFRYAWEDFDGVRVAELGVLQAVAQGG